MSSLEDETVRVSLLKFVGLGEDLFVPLGAVGSGVILLQCKLVYQSSATRAVKVAAILVTLLHAFQVFFEWIGSAQLTVAMLERGRATAFLWIEVPNTIITLIITLTVQLYFGRIAYHLLEAKRLLLTVGAILIVASTCGGIATAVAYVDVAAHGFQDNPYVFSGTYTAMLVLWLSSACILDITLSTVLCLNLNKQKKATILRSTKLVLSTALHSTLETFTLTACMALIVLVLEITPRFLSRTNPSASRLNIMAVSLVAYAVPRFYLFSFLYSLRRRAEASDSFHGKCNSCQVGAEADAADQYASTFHLTSGVHITTTVDVECDDIADKEMTHRMV